MGSTCVFSVTIFLDLSVQNPRYFVQYIEGLETSVLIYLMEITGAKFKHHPSNIFGDILEFVIYYSHVFSL